MAYTILRAAQPNEAQTLTDLALRSKAFWGYSFEFMQACRPELTILPEQIAHGVITYVVAEREGQVVGFYALAPLAPLEYELEALFVEPDQIGNGIGRMLLADALQRLAASGGRRLVIQSDPYAEPFYLAMGARRIGERESASIPGRRLPLLVIEPDA
jgi:GNAT superfamily N-acetyltransferase